MAGSDNKETIKITLEDLASVSMPAPSAVSSAASPALAPGVKNYGTITDASDRAPEIAEERGSFMLQGWFYLGAAGLLGAIVGWAICEPAFVDGPGQRW